MDRPTPSPKTRPQTASQNPSRAGAWLMLLAVCLSLISLKFPLLALVALAALVIAAAQSSGLIRILGLVIALPVVLLSSTLFLLQNAAPGIIASGRRAAESKAVARLRELHWAQDRAHLDAVCDFDGDGKGDYAFIGELTGEAGSSCQGGNPLRITSFRRVTRELLPSTGPSDFQGFVDSSGSSAREGSAQDEDSAEPEDSSDSKAPRDMPPPGEIYRGDGFNYVLYLPDANGKWRAEGEDFDRAANPKRWIAFAWPAAEGVALRSYFIDQNERVCESVDELAFEQNQIPSPNSGPITNWSSCEGSPEGVKWQAWKGKKPRESESGG